MKSNNGHTRKPATARPRLSLSMIVKNEEERLPACLESMQGVADEIVVVDTGSTDKTADIARRFGARVVEFPWNGNFSDARNESLRHCTGDWVIFLDADERLDRSHAARLRTLLCDPNVTAYELTVTSRSVDERNNVASFFGYIARLFRRREDILFQYRIHESVLPSVLRAHGRVVRADVTIDHIGYGGTDQEMRKKFERNLVPLRLDAVDYPDDLFVLEKLAQTAMLLRHDAEAEDVLVRILALCDAGAAGTLSSVKAAHNYNLLAELCLWTDRLADAEVYALRSAAVAPAQYQAHALLSRVYERQGRYELALEATRRLLDLTGKTPPFASTVEGDCNVLEEDIHYKRALLQKLSACPPAEVQRSLEAVVSVNADHRAAQTDLALLYAAQENIRGLVHVLRTIPRTATEHAPLIYVRGQALAKAGDAAGAITDLWAAFSHGLRSDDIIFLLVRLLNEQHRELEAIPLYEAYLLRHPDAADARRLLADLIERTGKK